MSVEAGRRYLTDVFTRALAAADAAPPTPAVHKGAPEDVRAVITAAVEDLAEDLVGLAERLHAAPETAFAEHRSAAAVRDLLARHGVDCELGGYGLPTSFQAVARAADPPDGPAAGPRAPTVAVLAEYDALPELGHACGHNIICAAAVGAFLAVRGVLDRIGGGVCLLGTPGEEGHAGKELMARAGAFNGIDAAVMVHPAGLDVANHPWLGARSAAVRFRGAAAHAAAMPFLGRNALDGIVLAYQGLGQLRQHILPDDRVHMVITEGGTVPGVIPAYAAGRVAVRSATPAGLRDLTARVDAVLRAAAAATGTDVEADWDERPAYLPVRSNGPLADRYAVNIEAQGRRPVPYGVLPTSLGASTDLGNVSVRVPAIHPLIRVSPPHVAIHTPEFARYATGAPAAAAVRDGAVALALTTADFLADAALRADVDADFHRQGGAGTPNDLLSGAGPEPGHTT